MRTIRINFNGFWAGFAPEDNLFYHLLRRHFQVEISPQPDFLFCSLVGGIPFEYCGTDCVRIFFSGENFSADFNLFDYCLGFDYLTYGDRYLRFPLWLIDPVQPLETRHLHPVGEEFLAGKTRFCNFIYGHQSHKGQREQMLALLAEQKPVACAGRHLNNMPDGFTVNDYDEKRAFQRNCKFSIAFESTPQPGFCTEKLVHAFESRTVPVYFGDETVADTFNPTAFINCHEPGGLAQAAARVQALDADDEAYLRMLNAPVFRQDGYVTGMLEKLEDFLVHVCEQPPQDAFRRGRAFAPKEFGDRLLESGKQEYVRALQAAGLAPAEKPAGLRGAAAGLMARLRGGR